MTRIAACLLSYALTSLWQLPLFAAAGWLVSRMLQRLGPVAQYRVWVTALVLGVAGPAWGLLPWGPGGSASTSVADLLTTAASAGRETAFAFHQGPLWLPPTVFWGLTIAYVASIGIRGFRLAWGLRATAALLRDAQPPAMTEAGSAVWERCQRRFAVGGARLL